MLRLNRARLSWVLALWLQVSAALGLTIGRSGGDLNATESGLKPGYCNRSRLEV
jgi:hypothetical protein